jgi:hypothetical protein
VFSRDESGPLSSPKRFPCPEDGRAINARLTGARGDVVVAAAPGNVATVRHSVVDPLNRTQLRQLRSICDALLAGLAPDTRLTGLYDPERDQPDAT